MKNINTQDFKITEAKKLSDIPTKLKLNFKDAYITVDVYRTDFTQQVFVDADYNTQEA